MRNAVDAARAHGITVRLAAPRPQMAKLPRITGLDRMRMKPVGGQAGSSP